MNYCWLLEWLWRLLTGIFIWCWSIEMKATEFVKKYGWNDAVKSYIAAYEDHLTDELKTLVNAYELVESYGGLKLAIYMRNHNMVLPEFMNDLKQSIELVESCT